jgi:hypothetical protein
MKNICHNFYRKIIFNASALTQKGETLKCRADFFLRMPGKKYLCT